MLKFAIALLIFAGNVYAADGSPQRTNPSATFTGNFATPSGLFFSYIANISSSLDREKIEKTIIYAISNQRCSTSLCVLVISSTPSVDMALISRSNVDHTTELLSADILAQVISDVRTSALEFDRAMSESDKVPTQRTVAHVIEFDTQGRYVTAVSSVRTLSPDEIPDINKMLDVPINWGGKR